MRAAYVCIRPECRTLTLTPSPAKPDDDVMLGVAAHISATAPGGPRYDKSLSPEQREHIENGIFLCELCATLIDKNQGQDHPIKLFHAWKAEYERWVAEQRWPATATTAGGPTRRPPRGALGPFFGRCSRNAVRRYRP